MKSSRRWFRIIILLVFVESFRDGAPAEASQPGLCTEVISAASIPTNVLVASKGTYTGLFFDASNPAHENSGWFTLHLRDRGRYNGVVQRGVTRISFKGQFDEALTSVSFTRHDAAETLTLSLKLEPASDRVIGIVTGGDWAADLVGYRANFAGRALHANSTELYTLLLTSTNDPSDAPMGSGFGCVKLAPTGRARFQGCLADGTVAAQTTMLSTNKLWPFYVALQGGHASIFGWLQLDTNTTGPLYWTRPHGISGINSSGFTNRVTVLGSHYTAPPHGKPALAITNGTLVLDGGNLENPLSYQVAIDARSKVTVASNTTRLELTFTPASGKFSGGFQHPQTGVKTALMGVVLQDQECAGGFFLGHDESGVVAITAKKMEVDPALDAWQSRITPLHSANNLNDVAFGNGQFVAVGFAYASTAAISTSPDGFTWTSRSSGIMENLRGVAFGSGGFVAVGNRGRILTSADGITWADRTLPEQTDLFSVGYGDGLFVAVGGNLGSNGWQTAVLTSETGITWAPQQSGMYGTLERVTYANGLWIAVGTAGMILTSPDGKEWTSRDSGTMRTFFGITYGAGLYVAVGGEWERNLSVIATSSDGMTWEKRENTASHRLVGVTFAQGSFVAVGDSPTILTSRDGDSWEGTSTEAYFGLSTIVYGNGAFVAVGGGPLWLNTGTILTSAVASNWIVRATGRTFALNGVAYGSGTFVAVGASGQKGMTGNSGSSIFTSADGVAWKSQPSITLQGALNAITYGNGQFVTVGDTGAIRTSTNGTAWVRQYSGLLNTLFGVTYGNGVFVAVSGKGITGYCILTSSNAVEWTSRCFDHVADLYAVTFGNGIFLAVGQDGAIAKSTNGINWETSTNNVLGAMFLSGITYGRGRYVITGWGPGVLISTPDGVTGTMIEGYELGGVTFANETFVAVGSEILTSTDSLNWSQRSSGIHPFLNGVAYGAGTFVAVGGDMILQSGVTKQVTPSLYKALR